MIGGQQPHYPPGPTTEQTVGAGHTKDIEILKRRAPVIPLPGVIEVLEAYVTGASVGTSLTAVNFTDGSSFNSGAFMDIDGGGDIRILDQGVYTFMWSTGSWTLTNNVFTTVRGQVNVTSGSAGAWHGNFGLGPETEWGWLIRADDPALNAGAGMYVAPDALAQAAWASTATFPVVLQTSIYKEEDGTGVSDSIDVRVTVTRLGSAFE